MQKIMRFVIHLDMKIFIFVQIYLIINTMHLENFLNFKNPRIEKNLYVIVIL